MQWTNIVVFSRLELSALTVFFWMRRAHDSFQSFGGIKRGSAELEFEIPAICNSSREHAGSLWFSKARYRLEALLDASGCHEIESLIPRI